jgi:hypothetical protein
MPYICAVYTVNSGLYINLAFITSFEKNNKYLYLEKAAFNKKKKIFTSKLDFNVRKRLVRCCVWSMVLKLGRSEQQIRNTWKDLKCGAGEEWRSVGPIM